MIIENKFEQKVKQRKKSNIVIQELEDDKFGLFISEKPLNTDDLRLNLTDEPVAKAKIHENGRLTFQFNNRNIKNLTPTKSQYFDAVIHTMKKQNHKSDINDFQNITFIFPTGEFILQSHTPKGLTQEQAVFFYFSRISDFIEKIAGHFYLKHDDFIKLTIGL